MTNTLDLDTPKVSAQEIQRLLSAELSLPARVAYTALLLVALAATGVIGSLWLTEPVLPQRTHIAFAALTVIGASWVGYAVWVLTRRRVLLAGHRIIAARMAVTFSTVFAAGFLALGVSGTGGRAAFSAAAFGALMILVAAGLLIHARRNFARLMERRRALEEERARR